MVRNSIFTILLLLTLASFSQNRIKDTIYGNVRTVREKLHFFDSLRQTYKLFADEGDYGHHGFRSRDIEQHRFNIFRYSMPIPHCLNYYREYDNKACITTESWFNKDNAFLTKYEFAYDDRVNSD